jgi:hypothetical protein
MRYVVYLLVAGNVLYLGWNLSQDKTLAQKEISFPPMPASVHSLVMLKEGTGNTVPETDREEGIEADNKNVATGNMHEGKEAEMGSTAVIAQTEPSDSRQAHLCKALGPFDKSAAAKTVSERLLRMGLIPMLRSEDSQVVDDYWVYMPGNGQEYSREVIRKLKDKNITDYYVYESKDYLVSLGTFKRIGSAEKQQAMLQQMGIDARIEERYKSRVEHWLEMYTEGKNNERLENIALETPGLQIKTESCMSLASR